MPILEFVEQSRRAMTREALFEALCAETASRGFEIVTYSDLRAAPDGSRAFFLTTLKAEVITDYARHLYRDSVATASLTANSPISWRQTAYRMGDAKLMDWMQAHSIQDGLSIPCHLALGASMAVAVGTSERSVLVGPESDAIGAVAIQFHLSMQRFCCHRPAVPRLTHREAEVLRWAAAGKSNWDVGEILHISSHTVDFHLRNAFRKLGTTSRVAAVLQAFAFGIINLP